MTKEKPSRPTDAVKRRVMAKAKADRQVHGRKLRDHIATSMTESMPAKDTALPVPQAESVQAAPVEAEAAPPPRNPMSRSSLMKDPIYRIMHRQPRSDQLEVVKCKFGPPQCEKAARYFDMSFMQNPLRRLRLQIGCQGDAGLSLFFPKIFHHRASLRLLDLSRNRLNADDVRCLCEGLDLGSVAGPESSVSCALEILDLSYNSLIGNEGAVHVLTCAASYGKLRALQLKCVGMDDGAAPDVHRLLKLLPKPSVAPDAKESLWFLAPRDNESKGAGSSFLLNLNENCIGAAGTVIIGRGLPDYVSVTMSKQRVQRVSRPWGPLRFF